MTLTLTSTVTLTALYGVKPTAVTEQHRYEVPETRAITRPTRQSQSSQSILIDRQSKPTETIGGAVISSITDLITNRFLWRKYEFFDVKRCEFTMRTIQPKNNKTLLLFFCFYKVAFFQKVALLQHMIT